MEQADPTQLAQTKSTEQNSKPADAKISVDVGKIEIERDELEFPADDTPDQAQSPFGFLNAGAATPEPKRALASKKESITRLTKNQVKIGKRVLNLLPVDLEFD